MLLLISIVRVTARPLLSKGSYLIGRNLGKGVSVGDVLVTVLAIFAAAWSGP